MNLVWIGKAVSKAGSLNKFNSRKLCRVFAVTLRSMSADAGTGSTVPGPALGAPAGQGNQKKMGKQKQKQNLRHLNYIARRGGEKNLSPPGLMDLLVVGTGAAGTPRSAFLDMTYFRLVTERHICCRSLDDS